MRKLKYAVVAVLVIAVVAIGLTLALTDRTNHHQANAAGTPINASWNPVYVDDQVSTPMSKADLVKDISPAVVSITTQTLSYNAFLQPVPQSGAASGVVIDPNGYIVTNNHVVDGAQSLKVTLSDGRSFDAVKWAGDSATDLAVLQIQPGGDLPYAHFLSNSIEKLGLLEDVVAVGNALALPGGPTWTEGVVSYLGRSIQESNGVVLDDLIQTDTAINPGNSGGPLVNMAGQVVGINTAIASGAENIGFAISTDTAISTVYSLVTKSNVSSAWLGVTTTTVNQTVKTQYGLSVDYGALVVQVVSGSPAENSGLRSNDVIIKLNDVEIKDSQSLGTAIQSHSPGDQVTITYMRGQSSRTTEVTLGQRPSG
jgi:serine protease Do